MKREKKELWIGIVFLALSIAYFAGSFAIPSYSGYGQQTIDSKFMPRLLGIMLAILSILQIVVSYARLKRSLNRSKSSEAYSGAATTSNMDDVKKSFDEDAYIKGSSIRSVVVIGVFLLFYVVTFKSLGFILSSMIFLLCTILYLTPKEKRNWFLILGLSIGIPIMVYFLFVSGFKLKLPPGILDF